MPNFADHFRSATSGEGFSPLECRLKRLAGWRRSFQMFPSLTGPSDRTEEFYSTAKDLEDGSAIKPEQYNSLVSVKPYIGYHLEHCRSDTVYLVLQKNLQFDEIVFLAKSGGTSFLERSLKWNGKAFEVRVAPMDLPNDD
jgi:hypothetical protein